MNTVPTNPAGREPADNRHPSWCSPAQCTSPDMLAERGIDETDVPRWMQGAHLSEPIVVGAGLEDRQAEATITLQAWRWIYQPPNEVVDGVDITIDAIERNHRMTASMSPQQLPQVVEAVIAMRDLVTSNAGAQIDQPRSVWVGRAIRALAAFGALGRADAERLLPMWRFYGEMSEADVETTLAWFTPAGQIADHPDLANFQHAGSLPAVPERPAPRLDMFPFDDSSNNVLAAEATLDPDDHSERAEFIREVAQSVRDHRRAYGQDEDGGPR